MWDLLLALFKDYFNLKIGFQNQKSFHHSFYLHYLLDCLR